MRKLLRRLKQNRLFILATIAGIIITTIMMNFEMNLLEAYLYDLRVRTIGRFKEPKLNTVLVTIDDKAVERLNEYPPLSMKTHLSLLKLINSAKPKSIAYFLDFSDAVPESNDSTSKKSKDPALTDAENFVSEALHLNESGTPVWIGTEADVTGEVLPPYPISRIPHGMSVIHKDGTVFAEDKVTRRAIHSVNDELSLHVKLANHFTGRPDNFKYHGIYRMPETNIRYFLINYQGKTQESETLGKQYPFKEISAADILEKKVSLSELEGKMVLVGTKSKENMSDFVQTPFNRRYFVNPKVVVHANILETLIGDSSILWMNRHIDRLITILLTAFVIVIVFTTKPMEGILSVAAIGSSIILLSFIIFALAGLWVNLSHPLSGIFAAYYLFVPYRLFKESRKRWEIEKKHEVLMQVEELKNNFMSLITHDLKTPVARIQGMSEILSRSGADEKIVTEIMNSTDELNNFITSILELSKIESNNVKIHRQSKDINKIIEDSVKKHEFQAHKKNINITTELEPLFPIMIDSALITKVICNLIDNAIKYSPDDSTIHVSCKESAESSDKIIVTIKDTGFGIAPKDLENLFAKFYRPKNDLNMKVKGSGLGLYLSRYFVELHHGTLNAESKENEGSTFTITLPTATGDTAAVTASNRESARFGMLTDFSRKFFNDKDGGNKYV